MIKDIYGIAEDASTRQALALEGELSRFAKANLDKDFLGAYQADAVHGYPGLDGLTPSKGLTRAERAIEAHFAQMIAEDPDGFVQGYLEMAAQEAGHEGYVNADMARMLYPPYADSLEARGFLEKATIAPAGYLALNLVWNEVLDQSQADARSEAIFVAGGMASGKSTRAVRNSLITENAAVIFDSVFGNYERAKFVVQQALDVGLFPRAIFIWRPFEDAVEGMLKRLTEEGRPVSIKQMAEGHFNAQKTFLRLSDETSGDHRIEFMVLKNFVPGDQGVVQVDDLRAKSYAVTNGDYHKVSGTDSENQIEGTIEQHKGQKEPTTLSRGDRQSSCEGGSRSRQEDSLGRASEGVVVPSLSGTEAERKAQMAEFAAHMVINAYHAGQINGAQARAALYGSSTARG